MQPDLYSAWLPALMTCAALCLLAWLPETDRHGRLAACTRAAAAALTALVTIRYALWRLRVMPLDQEPWQDAWAIIFVCFEMANIVSRLLTLFFMSRYIERSADADAAQGSPLLHAPTDVFIATYNEPSGVLERTIVGALDIQHPDLRVWVLDDGARPWVRELAEGLGARYLSRVKGKHAKAGNINNGLAHACATGRKPAFVLVLDADFIANPHILRRTLGLFTPDVGIVQTPQHFFNPDPIQTNLSIRHVWPDEQRFFFNVLLPSKDAWGAAFCCGTSAVMRVEALEAIGGIATETVTEDMLTSFKMLEHGWRTILLNERLSLGLAPEGLTEYVTQRGRWCLGGVQQIHTPWSPLGRGRIGLVNRISCFDAALYWLASFPFKIMMLATPALFWWTGTSVISADADQLLEVLLPSVLASIMFNAIWARSLIVPVMTDISQLLSSTVVIRNAMIGLFRPGGRAFKVTPKGISRDGIVVQWTMLWPFLVIATATIVGLALNASSHSPLAGLDGFSVNVVWSIFSVAVTSLVCLACIERPRRRTDERFASGERAVVLWPGRAGTECQVSDISLGGAKLTGHNEWEAGKLRGDLLLDGGRLTVPFQVLRSVGKDLVIQFEERSAVRRVLIARLFGGDYTQELEDVRMAPVLWTLVQRLIG